MNKWISVQDGKPTKTCRVLAVNNKGYMWGVICFYHHDLDLFLFTPPLSVETFTLDVTHWIEIPEIYS